jgi:DNA/RNA endonuclease G (NUC1)
MKKILIIFIIFFISLICSGQTIEKYDTIIDVQGYYKAYYNKNIQGSTYVIYKLYKGGGDIPRVNIPFKPYKKLPHFRYGVKGYDRGHLANAEDFAYSKNSLISTFYYINCVPQNTKLNRGSWKKIESDIRKLSQTDSLLIICGGCDYNRKDNYLIPKNCFKIVYSLSTKKCVCSLLFYNDNSGFFKTENKLKRKITFKKALNIYNN